MTFKLRLLTVACVCTAMFVVLGDAVFSVDRVAATPASQTTAQTEQTISHRRTPADMCRSEDQTFLTYPEWFLVYSPREYADMLEQNDKRVFPFMQHIGQFWQGYAAVTQATRDRYDFNGDYHLMVSIIGVSTSIEYTSKWAYESTIGRLANAVTSRPTHEDTVAAETARQYEQFLDTEAWYNFDYVAALKRVWQEPKAFDTNPFQCIRKWERKYALTTEYLLKSMYAKAMRVGAESTYGTISSETFCIVKPLNADDIAGVSDVRIVDQYSDDTALIVMPRYQRFTDTALMLAKANVQFIEIAGNRDAIVVTAIVPDSFQWDRSLLFSQPILTSGQQQRIAFEVPVDELQVTLTELLEQGGAIEHVYDY